MDSETEVKLRDLRLELAEICLDARIDKIAALSNASTGDALAAMYNTGLRQLPMSKSDQAIAERCHRMLTVEHDPVRKACAYLALSLFMYSYRIERSFELIDVPTEIVATMVRALLGLPQFFEKDGARRQALTHLSKATEEIHKAARVIDEIDFRRNVLDGFLDGFILTPVYGEDVSLRDISVKRAELIQLHLQVSGLLHEHVPVWPSQVPEQLRIGILSPGAQSEMAAIRGHLFGLSKERFNITAFVPNAAADSVSRGVDDLADALISLPVDDIAEAAAMVIREDLDVLICAANITNICTFPWTQLMAQRLARLQVAMHASPMTSGFDTVDLYINGALNEPEDADADYTEQLALVEGSSNHYHFIDGVTEPQALTRRDLGLPDTGTVFVSGANAFKIGPDLVRAWTDILGAVKDSHLVLYPFNPNWSAHYPQRKSFVKFLHNRFAAAGIDIGRLHLLESQPSRAPILGLLKLADIYLDSFPYSGAVSIIDPLLCGCPPVVLSGETARCRQSAALLREIDLDVMVTESRDDYVAVAVRLSSDVSLRDEISQAVEEMTERAGLGRSDFIGGEVGELIWHAFESRLNNSPAIEVFVGNFGTPDGLTQLSGNFQLNFLQQNGAKFGNFAGVSIGDDGIVTALFDNGVTRPVFQIPVATFTNPNGLNNLSGNVWISTDNSGNPVLREAGDAGAGAIASAALESSTVDLGQEFTRMITTQRAYSSAAKVITTADDMLDELLRIKR